MWFSSSLTHVWFWSMTMKAKSTSNPGTTRDIRHNKYNTFDKTFHDIDKTFHDIDKTFLDIDKTFHDIDKTFHDLT